MKLEEGTSLQKPLKTARNGHYKEVLATQILKRYTSVC